MYMYTCTYVRDQCKTRTVLKPSDGFEACKAGKTVLQLFISTTEGFLHERTNSNVLGTHAHY